MNQATTYIRNMTFVLEGLLVIFVGLCAIGALLGQASWSEAIDWSCGALFVAVALFVVNALCALIAATLRSKK